MFITRDPWALELCQRIGFDNQLIGTNEEKRKAFVTKGDRLVPVPSGFTLMSPARAWPVVKTPLLSIPAKLRLAWEYFVPRQRGQQDESLADFARRRMGRGAYERLIQPLIGGIYTADPEKLSMAATMQQFREMEQKHGGLIRAMRRQKASQRKSTDSGARYSMFVAPREGMSSFVKSIAGRLPANSIRLQTPVTSLQCDGEHWRISANGQTEVFDGVIVAAPAPKAAPLIKEVDQTLANELAAIRYASTSVVVLGYRRDQFQHALDGFGFVVPLIEGRRILAGSFASVKFDGRAPDDCVLVRVFIGGACQPELADLPDDELHEIAHEELRSLLGTTGGPQFAETVRWREAMPQYHVGHLDRIKRIDSLAAELSNFELAGNAYRGVGIPFCVRSGEEAAKRLLCE